MDKKDSKFRLYLFRKLGEAVDATRMMWMTEFELSHDTDTDTEDTMDGSYSTEGSTSTTATATAKMAYGDTFADEVEDATVDKTPYEMWEIESKIEGTGENAGRFKAKYFQGKFNKFTLKGETGGVDEYELEYGVNGRFQRGYATIPDEVEQKLDANGYKFHNTTADDPATENLESIPQPKVNSSSSSTSTSNSTSTSDK